MASDKPSLVLGQEHTLDPFITTGPNAFSNHRFSNFDGGSLALGPGASPTSAKRALEAHLADTERRMEEAGKLGTALVQQQKELSERLKEVEQLETEEELSPDLKEKLAAIEKDFNEVARDSARAFLPKHRIPSNEVNSGAPFTPTKDVVRRSMSPSKFDNHKFESLATGSPSKFSAPSRKMRNQPANRIHDIEFAAEISTSLITQVRNLQALLQEREEEAKDLKSEKAGLEVEVQGFQQRMKNLDESESRYKDENWTLETQIQEFIAGQKEAADREKKLSHALNALQADKNAKQRELDEIRLAHTKLAEDHAAAVKHHDIELGTAKRNAVMAEGERAAMQRKIDELTSQNQELAKAISGERGRTSQRNSPAGSSEDDGENVSGNLTPEHSPPPSPIKPTPRHAMLETETLKTSLQHAQRTIQSLRSNVHREKTEKLELKRLLQDARDDLEKLRSDPVERPHQKRAREAKSREFKKPAKLDKLGTARAIKAEIFEDPEWEDASVRGPPLMLARMTAQADIPDSNEMDDFETANEAHESTDAFETAHEQNGTETEAFQTGAEDFDSDDTEMESPSARAGANRANALKKAAIFAPVSKEYSYESTASTSASEDEDYIDPMRTPNTQPRKVRMRTSHGHFSRRSRQFSGDQTYQGSPASQISHTNRSFSSTNGLPRQSLFAELGELDGSDEDSTIGTPGQRSLRSITPASTTRGTNISPRSNVPLIPAMPGVIMVDSGMMTEPLEVESIAALAGSEEGLSMGSAVDNGLERPSSVIHIKPAAQRDHDIDGHGQNGVQAKQPMPLGGLPAPILAPPQQLSLSNVYSEQVEPQALSEPLPPRLALSSVRSEHVEPVSEPAVAPPAFSMSGVQSEEVEPVSVPRPQLGFSGVSSEHVAPVSELEVPPPVLSMSSVAFEAVEPVVESFVPPTLSMSPVVEQQIEPNAEAKKPLPPLAFSAVSSMHTQPIAEPETEPRVVTVVEYRDAPKPPPATLAFSPVSSAETQPIAEAEPEPRVVTVVEYKDAPKPPPATLAFSSISSAETEPIAEAEQEPRVVTVVEYRDAPQPPPATLAFSSVSSAEAAPVAEREVEPRVVTVVEYKDAPTPPPAELMFSEIASAEVVPVAEPEREPQILRVIERVEAPRPPPAALSFSSLISEDIEPYAEPTIPPPTLTVSSLITEVIEPQAEAEVPQPVLSVSNIVSEHIEPKAERAVLPPTLSVSQVVSEHIEPVSPVATAATLDKPTPATLDFSSIRSLDTKPAEPQSPIFGRVLLPALEFSAIEALDTEPTSPRSPKRNGFIIPRDQSAQDGDIGLASTRDTKVSSGIVIAEDETRGSPRSPQNVTADSQRPFGEISGNAEKKPVRNAALQTTDSSAQTSLTAETIDQILHSKPASPQPVYQRSDSVVGSDHLSTPGTIRIHRSHDSLNHNARSRDNGAEAVSESASRRPGSAASARSPTKTFPPLPSNHREVIEAARTGTANSGHGTIGSMGPPLFPASAYKNPMNRPRTPASISSKQGGEQATRPERLGTAEIHSPTRLAPRSRKSSVSSFASEVDHRFNMASGMMGMAGHGFGPNTDPRMIQAITQTMIGEYLWKYTRKTGRGEMSEKRHRRYFWVHPYTRTLYWSDRDPTSAGRSELRAKSVPIEAVRVVTDDNPMPPGLHRKSLIIVAPGRSVKFTCTTGQRHETWFNALSYLLLRTEGEGQADTEEIVSGLTREDVEEFNPSYDPRGTSRAGPRGAPSIASYNSRATMQSAASFNLEVPTLTPNHKKAVSTSSVRPGLAGRISGYWKNTQDSLSMRSRSGVKDQTSLYSNNEVHDSAEDLREMYERQDRESDRLDNVRACCDGRHDVGTLHKKKGPGHHSHSQTHLHAHPSRAGTPSTVRSGV